jgi:hypothetical protein
LDWIVLHINENTESMVKGKIDLSALSNSRRINPISVIMCQANIDCKCRRRLLMVTHCHMTNLALSSNITMFSDKEDMAEQEEDEQAGKECYITIFIFS